MRAMAGISEELDALCVSLVQAAIDLLDAGAPVPVMLAADCEDALFTFEDDTPDGCYRAAREKVGELGSACTRYALLYDGVVQEDESDAGAPALLFEFAERGMAQAWSGYVLYRSSDDGVLEFSDPLPAGEEELLFA